MDHQKLATDCMYEINPVPQELISLEGTTSLTPDLHIIVQTDLKEATLQTLHETLHVNGYTYTMSDTFEKNKTNIYLTNEHQMNKKWIASYHTEPITEISRREGYQLIIDGDSAANIAIIGNDPDGVHYGVVTLNLILKQVYNRVIQKCVIRDYPEILYRGFIEGFYGYPWSHEDRMDLMKFGAEQKLNTYIYAPKDDPYHRKHWRDLYPPEKAKEISELAAAGHANNINFVWTIHPGDTMDLSLEEDFQSAVIKLEQLYTLGVRQFGVLFDDLVGVPNGVEQAAFINRIDTEFVKAHGDIRPLITVGTRYCEAWGPSMTDYFKPFVETLHNDVEIMWTGAATMSNISKEQYESPKREIQSDKNLSVWWNYPVNDYCDSKILMGKIENLSSDLDNVNGFFANPMNQPQASKQALFCIADHNWNTHAYDSDRSFSASFKALAPEVAEELQMFASNSCYLLDDGGVSGDFLFDESWELKADVEHLISAVKLGTDVTAMADRLLVEFKRMENAADRIFESCQNKHLVEELRPFLNAFKLMAQSGQHVVQAITAMQQGDLLVMECHNEKALEQLLAMEHCKVHRLKEDHPHDFTVDVGTNIIKPFLSEMIVLTAVKAGTEQKPLKLDYEMKNLALKSAGITASASSCVNENENADKVIEGTISSGKWCSSEHRPHLTIDLQRPVSIKQYRIINCGHPEAREPKMWNTRHAQILVSNDGENFTIIDEFKDNRDDVVNRMLKEEVTARYIRLQIIEPAQISVDGSGHTRIYGFELFDERYPEQSPKVLTSEIQMNQQGHIVIKHVKEGDVISLYRSLEDKNPFVVSEPAAEDGDVTFKDIDLGSNDKRIFVERTSSYALPSIRTSKGFVL